MKSNLRAPLHISYFSAQRCALLSLLGLVASTTAQASAPDASTLQKLNRASVPFVVNAGQWDKRAAFAAQTFAGTVFVTTDGALVYSLPGKPMADATATDGVALPNHPKSKHAASPEQRGPGWALSERFVFFGATLRVAEPTRFSCVDDSACQRARRQHPAKAKSR